MKATEAARKLGLKERTLRDWEAKGVIHPKRDSTGARIYTQEDLKVLANRLKRGRDEA